jgi:hypothetical protein
LDLLASDFGRAIDDDIDIASVSWGLLFAYATEKRLRKTTLRVVTELPLLVFLLFQKLL